MNLTKLFEMQRELDERIVKEKGLEGMDLLPQKILALQVELGECANEWRGFKFWSEDREARTSKYVLKKEYQHLHISQTGAYEYQLRDEYGNIIFDDVTDEHHDHKNPLLEEYIDCLHFILSIGLTEDLLEELPLYLEPFKTDSITTSFIRVFDQTGQLDYDFDAYEYETLLQYFIGLGEMLGFTWDQIEEAYMAKNSENHRRQSTGY